MGAKNGSPTKMMRDALMLELSREDMIDGEKLRRARRVANALVSKALEGDVSAIKEINDRVDGKVPQAVQHGGGESPIEVNVNKSPLEAAREVALAMRLGIEAMKQSEDT